MGIRHWPEDATNECERIGALLAVEKAKTAMLLKAIDRLIVIIPRSIECKDMHHPSKWRHEHDETCPSVVEYGRAIHNALAAIKAAKG